MGQRSLAGVSSLIGRALGVRCEKAAEAKRIATADSVPAISAEYPLAMSRALQFLVLTVAGWVNRHQEDLLQQQARFDTFIAHFNHERPHQALGMKVPGELYTRSPRPYLGLAPLVPFLRTG